LTELKEDLLEGATNTILLPNGPPKLSGWPTVVKNHLLYLMNWVLPTLYCCCRCSSKPAKLLTGFSFVAILEQVKGGTTGKLILRGIYISRDKKKPLN